MNERTQTILFFVDGSFEWAQRSRDRNEIRSSIANSANGTREWDRVDRPAD